MEYVEGKLSRMHVLDLNKSMPSSYWKIFCLGIGSWIHNLLLSLEALFPYILVFSVVGENSDCICFLLTL